MSEDADTNLNTEILAVAMFDKYGNAIAGYRVEFEILDQGETDEGTIDTYHPYAHFSDVAHTEDEVVEEPGMDDWDATAVAGIYDRGKWVDTNLIWDGADDEDDYGFYDDDKAIGFTLDGAINFNYDLDCAAWAELTLDETYGMLDDMDEGSLHHRCEREGVLARGCLRRRLLLHQGMVARGAGNRRDGLGYQQVRRLRLQHQPDDC